MAISSKPTSGPFLVQCLLDLFFLVFVPDALIISVCQLMPSSEPQRVFISYARKDGASLAQRL
jgi:hypothetical protein